MTLSRIMKNVVNFREKYIVGQVPGDIRTSPALHLPGHPQHPPLLRHEESRAEEAHVDDQQDEAGWRQKTSGPQETFHLWRPF